MENIVSSDTNSTITLMENKFIQNQHPTTKVIESPRTLNDLNESVQFIQISSPKDTKVHEKIKDQEKNTIKVVNTSPIRSNSTKLTHIFSKRRGRSRSLSMQMKRTRTTDEQIENNSLKEVEMTYTHDKTQMKRKKRRSEVSNDDILHTKRTRTIAKRQRNGELQALKRKKSYGSNSMPLRPHKKRLKKSVISIPSEPQKTINTTILDASGLIPSNSHSNMSWQWSYCDVYFQSISSNDLEILSHLRQGFANIIAANPHVCNAINLYESDGVYLHAMKAEANDTSTGRMELTTRRGRWYADVWEEEDFIKYQRRIELDAHENRAKKGIRTRRKHKMKLSQDWDQNAIACNSELVVGYNDDCFRRYISQLENAWSMNQQNQIDGCSNESDRTDETQFQAANTVNIPQNVLPSINSTHIHPAFCGWIVYTSEDIHCCHPAAWNKREEFNPEEINEYSNNNDHTNNSESDLDLEETSSSSSSEFSRNVIDQDEISYLLQTAISQLALLATSNWRKAVTLSDRAVCHLKSAAIHEQEAASSNRLEKLYEKLYPYRNEDGTLIEFPRESLFEPPPRPPTIPLRTKPLEIVEYCMYQCKNDDVKKAVGVSVDFSLRLSLGDEVDVITSQGVWNEGNVVQVYRTNEQFVQCVRIELGLCGGRQTEWISVLEGRILPQGISSGKRNLTLQPNVYLQKTTEVNQSLAELLYESFKKRRKRLIKRLAEIPQTMALDGCVKKRRKRKKQIIEQEDTT